MLWIARACHVKMRWQWSHLNTGKAAEVVVTTSKWAGHWRHCVVDNVWWVARSVPQLSPALDGTPTTQRFTFLIQFPQILTRSLWSRYFACQTLSPSHYRFQGTAAQKVHNFWSRPNFKLGPYKVVHKMVRSEPPSPSPRLFFLSNNYWQTLPVGDSTADVTNTC